MSNFVGYVKNKLNNQKITEANMTRAKDQKKYGTLFVYNKSTRCTNFPNLLRHETLHVSGSSSAHHEEFIHCTLGTGVCYTGL